MTGIALFGATGDVYAATDFGVLRLPAGASHWEAAGSGLPTAAVYGLTLSQSANVLYAATHGRGAWELTLPRHSPRVEPNGAAPAPSRGGTSSL